MGPVSLQQNKPTEQLREPAAEEGMSDGDGHRQSPSLQLLVLLKQYLLSIVVCLSVFQSCLFHFPFSCQHFSP